MIDTIKLLLTDYDASGANLTVQPSSYDAQTGVMRSNFLLWKNGAREVYGSKAYGTDGLVHVDIKPQVCRDGMGYSRPCYVHCELPKLIGGDNYHALDFKQTKQALRQLQNSLKEMGIKADVRDAEISRLDSFRNAVTSEPYSCYVPVLSVMQGTRVNKREYGNGFLWENQSQEVCAYDKLEKMRHDKLSVEGLPPNTIRFEHRLMKAKKVREALSFGSVRDLLSSYDSIARVYRETMKKQLFKHTPKDVEQMLLSDIQEDMEYFALHFGRNWLQSYLTCYGMHCLLQKASIETILAAVEAVTPEKSKRSRLKSKLQVARFDSQAFCQVPGTHRTTAQLYEELQEKVLNPPVWN